MVTVWENLPFNQKGYSDFAFETVRPRVLAEADAFLAVTGRARDALVLEGADPARIHVIPMGVDLERFRPAPADPDLRSRLGLPPDGLVVLFVGAMSPHKGLSVLLHAVKRVPLDPGLRRTSFSVLLVGRVVGGARNMVARLGLGHVVRIVDDVPCSEVPVLYNLAAIFVFASVPTPTWQEQFAIVLVEAWPPGRRPWPRYLVPSLKWWAREVFSCRVPTTRPCTGG